jgi:uncharacterized protein
MNALRRSLGTLALWTAFGAWAQTPANCPPTATMPSPQEMTEMAAQASDRGLLWRVSKGGRSAYLYGTLHLGRAAWMFPGPLLRQALNVTNTLALELDLTDPAVMTALQTAMAAVPKPALSPRQQERIDRLTAAACLPPGALGSLHPVMQAITLMVLSGRHQALDPAFSQEAGLAGFARARNMAVMSLEKPGDQVSVLLPSDPAKALAAVDKALAQLESGTAQRMLVRLSESWRQGLLEDLQAYETWCDCANTEEERADLRRLNDERNPALARGLDTLHAQGRNVLVAVGALHMVGPKALPLLLKEMGYEVERLKP